ncbi:MAG: hypothetical protein LH606_18035, partial [Cytophagaceae bacterium]|nr:hypothetical protein [Cytophagaceae bacterium]
MRAVLWHQGETDNVLNTSAGEYAAKLRSLIDFSRAHTGGKNIAWVIARVSLQQSTTVQSVIDGQNAVINPGGNIFGGPFTDGIQNPRPDGVHFQGEGHRQHAQSWFEALLNNGFFDSSQPQLPPPPPAIAVVCNSANSLTFNVQGGFSAHGWADAQGNPVNSSASITGSSGSTFWPRVTDGTGNTLLAQPVGVPASTLPAPPGITAEGPTTVCVGASARLASNGRFDDLWSNGAVSRSITPNQPGNYTVKTRGGYGCYSEASQPVAVGNFPAPPPAPQITASGPTTFCPENNVTLTASEGLNYEWSTGSKSRTVSVNQAGLFSVKIIDANGCSSVHSSPTEVKLFSTPAAPIITASGKTTFCEGGDVSLTASTALVYQWSNGATTPSVNTRASGRFTLTIKDANGCVSPTSAETAVLVNALPPKPSITPDGSTTVCDGTTVRLTAANPPALPATFLWNSGARTRDVPVTRTGTFRLTITDANGCTAKDSSDALVVTVNPNPAKPSIVAAGPTTFCADKSVVLTATPEAAYRWSNGATAAAIVTNTTGRFTVRVLNQYNCISVSSDEVTTRSNPLPAAPRISAGGVTEFCQGDSVRLFSDSFLETGWNLTADRTKCTQAVKTGNFFATVTDANGCVSPPSNSIFVDARPLPSTPVIERVGAYTVEATGNVAGDDYNWQLGGQPISFRTQAIKVVSEGEYTVRTRLEYQVSAPVNRLVCFSKPSPGFKFTFEPGDSGLSVYPNPSQGQVTIETK